MSSDNWPTNANVAAALNDTAFVANADYANARQPDLNRLGTDASYWPNEASVVGAGAARTFIGHVLAARGSYLAGYSSKYGFDAVSVSTVWHGNDQRALGTGVAFGVNSNGDIVGDDRPSLRSKGHAYLWQSNRGQALCSWLGTAFVIRNKQILGQGPHGAFIIRDYVKSKDCESLSALVPSGWKIDRVFESSENGTILAYGAYHKGLATLLLLKPIKTHAFAALKTSRR